MENPKPINDHLREKWGWDITGMQKFRIAFSDNEFEVDGVTPKYSYILGRWMLERWIPDMREYCCIWAFSINGAYIFPQIEWCDQLCYLAMTSPEEKRKDLKAMEEEELKRFIANTEAYLEGEHGGGVHELKNQKVNFVRPVFMNLDFEINQTMKRKK